MGSMDYTHLAADIKRWGSELGFQHVAITDIDLGDYGNDFIEWLERGFNGTMDYMARNRGKRIHPAELVPGTVRIISARMNYLTPDTDPVRILKQPELGYVSRYALGRDYHKVLRRRLMKLSHRISAAAGDGEFRAFTDSAPVMEKPLAEKSGLGWIGKHSLVLDRHSGSWFFLGEIFTNLPLPADAADRESHCGRCRACINVCPTGAIVGDRKLDARRCISYQTIENRGAVPVELRAAIGNRVFGCDDCQLVCPWNRYASYSAEADFRPRHGLEGAPLLELFGWSEEKFLACTEGMALRRIGYPQWQRNVAIALGNAPYDPDALQALRRRRDMVEPWLAEHFDWAIERQLSRAPTAR
jgi:epoxyqueuosine reductase